ncbi:MAG: hypothetical protein Q9169_007644 [Polycauliona sp. 2 TL-2023]
MQGFRRSHIRQQTRRKICLPLPFSSFPFSPTPSLPFHHIKTKTTYYPNRHPLGSRAHKSTLGILTVRFELPFPIWCSTCPKPTLIGQGVRFNAEKKKVGNYYTTPIFSFRMKHIACSGWIEIRTDPKNTAYVVTSGATKRDLGDDVVREGDWIMKSEEEKERIKADAFASLEGRVEEKKQVADDKTRIEELYFGKERDWDDPFVANKRLRKTFRVERKGREKEGKKTEALKDRMSFGLDLLAENEDDRRRAGFVEFGGDDGGEMGVLKARSKPLFGRGGGGVDEAAGVKGFGARDKGNGKGKAVKDQRERLRVEWGENTRAAVDPFLVDGGKREGMAMKGIKRKKPAEQGSLVDYGSDSS